MAKLTGPEKICKNCDTEFVGHFCPNCGQSVRELDQPFNVLIIDLLGNMWAFDTRVVKTIKSLLVQPGQMALDYVAGKRARYMPPFRLYIFISFFFFLLLNISTSRVLKDDIKISKDSSIVIKGSSDTYDKQTDKNISDKDVTKGKEILGNINENKAYYTSRFISFLSWSLFILMPFYSFLLWILFRKKQKHFLAHFIFSINQHAFLFLLFIILLSVNLIFPNKDISPESWILLLYPIYVVIGARTLYKKSWISTTLRITLAHFIYLLIVTVAIGIIFYFTFSKALAS